MVILNFIKVGVIVDLFILVFLGVVIDIRYFIRVNGIVFFVVLSLFFIWSGVFFLLMLEVLLIG